MSAVTDEGRQAIADLSARYGLSQDAVEAMARAVGAGGGTMAQFNIPELGGNGQWMAGGMTMVGDMFNTGLQNTVSNLCGELSRMMANTRFFEAPVRLGGGSSWWPQELGSPSSSGGQNQLRYAYFPSKQRLAVDFGDGSPVMLLDTLDHNIGGFGQQQQGSGDPYHGVSFSSQYGQFGLMSLPIAVESPHRGVNAGPAPAQQAPAAPATAPPEPPAPAKTPAVAHSSPQGAPVSAPSGDGVAGIPGRSVDEIMAAIEKLAELHGRGVLTESEFSAKKAELLSRL